MTEQEARELAARLTGERERVYVACESPQTLLSSVSPWYARRTTELSSGGTRIEEE